MQYLQVCKITSYSSWFLAGDERKVSECVVYIQGNLYFHSSLEEASTAQEGTANKVRSLSGAQH